MAAASSAAARRRSLRATVKAPTAVVSWLPLVRAKPSLAVSATGSRPARARATRAGRRSPAKCRLALADQGEGDMGERRQIAARPDRPFPGHDGQHVTGEHRHQPLDNQRPHAALAKGQGVGAKNQEGAHDGRFERRSDAGGMAAHEVQLQRRDLVGGDPAVGEMAEAGRDAVDRGVGGEGPLHDPTA